MHLRTIWNELASWKLSVIDLSMIMLHRVHCALDLEVQLISLVFVTKQEDTKKDESKLY